MFHALIYPYCNGMERSGSRVTWQIVKELSPEEPPADWYPDFRKAVYGNALGESREHINWPMRGHEYYPTIPVVYTYRNPTEAFLSLYSRLSQDIGKSIPGPTGEKFEHVPGVWVDEMSWDTPQIMTKETCMKRGLYIIGKHWDIWKKYQAESNEGRKVLLLRYEDYYADHALRVKTIADFMGVDLSEEELFRITEKTSLETNLRLSSSIIEHHPDALFGVGTLKESGLQKGHVNPNVKGMPGLHLQAQPRLVAAVRTANSGALQALKEMTIDMGYHI